MFNDLPVWQKNHLEDCKKRGMFEGKRVLEVGGGTPADITRALNVKSWTCVDPAFSCDLREENYEQVPESILNYNEGKKFDLIFSTNAFEHIIGLDKAFENMYNLLEAGGLLSALYGPIYSSYKGHHVYVYYAQDLVLSFNDAKIQNWGHLLYGTDKLVEILSKFYNEQTLNTIKEQLGDWDYLNKLFYDDYIEIINKSKFDVLELRDWHESHYPDPKTQKILEEKYKKKNFSTVSMKIILRK